MLGCIPVANRISEQWSLATARNTGTLIDVFQELADLRVNFEYTTRKLEDYEKALEELGGHLSEYVRPALFFVSLLWFFSCIMKIDWLCC